jgi:hypothetical protein
LRIATSRSPLGDRIAFYAHSTLVVVATDGTRLDERLSDYYVEPPEWSFDGTLVAVETPYSVFVFPNVLAVSGCERVHRR